MAGEIKISSLPEILSGSYGDSAMVPTVKDGVTYKIDIENLRPILLKYYNLTSESFDSSSDIQIPVSSQIYAEIQELISSSIETDAIVYAKIQELINEQTASIHISSSQEINNDNFANVLVSTDTDAIILKLSGTNNFNRINISKIDSGYGYVRISSSYNETILGDPYFDLYYQHESINLLYNSASSNYIQI